MFKKITRLAPIYCLFLLLPARIQCVHGRSNQELTEEQARTLLQAKVTGSGNVGFATIRKFDATANTKHLSQDCLDEAKSKHLELYREGVLVNLLRTGGFVILEFDAKTELATRLHLVTQNETGNAVIKSEMIEGHLSKNDAMLLSRENESFSRAVLRSPSSQLNDVWRAFGGAAAPTFADHGDQGYFTIPDHVAKLSTHPDELIDLSALSATFGLWPIRYAPSLSIFAASPSYAVKMARDMQFKLVREFLEQKNEKPEFIYDLTDLESIKTHDKLRDRIKWLRELNSFLNQHGFSPAEATTREANLSIAMIPFFLGVMKHGSDRVFAVMSISGLISEWVQNETGKFILRDVSEGE
jgi:hypothetical protein